MGHLAFKVLFILTDSFCSFSPQIEEWWPVTSHWKHSIYWPQKLCGGVKSVADNLIALLHLNLYLFTYLFFCFCSLFCQHFKSIPPDEVKRLARLSNHGTIKNCRGGVRACGKKGGGIKSSHLDSAKKSSLGFDKQIMSFCVITPGPQISEEINQSQACC